MSQGLQLYHPGLEHLAQLAQFIAATHRQSAGLGPQPGNRGVTRRRLRGHGVYLGLQLLHGRLT